jgi:peptidoglycan hydrolase-like protein with peptidoglycan-binding domain
MIMIRKLIVSLTASFVAAASLPAGARAEAPPAPELVKEIQSRLFDLGYIVWPDGNWDDRTKAAVKAFHQLANRPGSDEMSADDVAYLRTPSPNKVWGGVVYDSKGHYRFFTNEASRKELVDKEISYCKQGYEASRCQLDLILSTQMANKGCIGISHVEWKDEKGNHFSTAAARAADIKIASDHAINECAKAGPRESCILYAAACADGSSQTGVLENKP